MKKKPTKDTKTQPVNQVSKNKDLSALIDHATSCWVKPTSSQFQTLGETSHEII